jgi:hypothetical protein
VRIAALALIAIISFSTVFAGAQRISIGEELVSVQTAESVASKNLFNVDLLYAYVQPNASSAVAVLKFTSISNVTLPSDSGITEVYTIQVFSRGNVVGTKGAIGCTIGESINGSFLMDLAMSFGHFSGSQGGGLRYCEVFYEPLNPTLAELISISVIRLGWITVDGNSTQTNLLHNETITHVELSKYQNGFLYNTLLPQEQLPQIDLFSPLKSFNATSPTPTPTSSPTHQQAEPFPTALVVASVVLVAVIGIGLLVYFKKRKR